MSADHNTLPEQRRYRPALPLGYVVYYHAPARERQVASDTARWNNGARMSTLIET